MRKRTAGTPLSEAELRQRRAAAQTRWAAATLTPKRLTAAHRKAQAENHVLLYRGSPVGNEMTVSSNLPVLYGSRSRSVGNNYARFVQAQPEMPYKGGIVSVISTPRAGLLNISDPTHRAALAGFLMRRGQKDRFFENIEDNPNFNKTGRIKDTANVNYARSKGIRDDFARQIWRYKNAMSGAAFVAGEDKLSQEIKQVVNYPMPSTLEWLKANNYHGIIDDGRGLTGPHTGKAQQRVIQAFTMNLAGVKQLGRVGVKLPAVIGAIRALLHKRDLTEAEHQQRVDAAKSRWAAVAVSVNAAAAVGGLAAGAAQRYATRKAEAAIHDANAPSREAEAVLNQRLARIEARAKEAKLNPGTANLKFLTGAKKAFGVKVRLAAKALRDSPPPIEDIPSFVPEVHPPTAHLADMKAKLNDLILRGKVASKTKVEAAIPSDVSAHSRSIRANASNWSPGAEEKLQILLGHAGLKSNQPVNTPAKDVQLSNTQKDLLSYEGRVADSIAYPEAHDGVAFETVRTMLQDSKIKNLDDLTRVANEVPRQYRASFLEAHMLPAQARAKKTREVGVKEHIRGRAAHVRRIDGYPKKAARKQIAKTINYEISRARGYMVGRAMEAHVPKQAAANAASAAAEFSSQRALGALKAIGTYKAAAVGAVAAGLAAYFYANRSRAESNNVALTKAEGEPTIEESLAQTAGVFQAGSDVEASLASRLTRALTGLKDDIAERLGVARGGSIHDTMLTDLDRAMRPVDTALKAGAKVKPLIEDPRAFEVALTLQARSALPEAFVQSYRLDRVRELAGDQRDAIKAVLLSAAKDGAPPAEMARRIRQTVGLTTHQAGLVLNYRRQLETGDPRALTRALRDKRFDSTVTKAIGGKKLTTQQIDKLTDSYHRKFLAYRANTIARTESLRAANNGHIAGVEQLLQDNPGMDVIKTWMATNDARTRHDHRILDGQSVLGLQTPFVADDGTEIRWPHDPDASASQTVSCRCTISTSLVPRTAT